MNALAFINMFRVYYENLVSWLIRRGSEHVDSFVIGETSPSGQMFRVYKITAAIFTDGAELVMAAVLQGRTDVLSHSSKAELTS